MDNQTLEGRGRERAWGFFVRSELRVFQNRAVGQ
jgi:hypothetical protein